MIRFFSVCIFSTLIFLVLCGCVSTEDPSVVRQEDVLLILEPGLRPETLLFPEYLLLEDFELEAHGRIPKTIRVGAGLKTQMGLKTVLRRYRNILMLRGWRIDQTEQASQSFRLVASKKAETLEVRAVQGTGPTQVFILYKPAK